MSRTTKVNRVAGWAGWCSPCESEDRPLVLTRIGPAGVVAWLNGLGDDDRLLLLTCNVCGHWQVVPRSEQDDPEIVLVEDTVVEAVHEVLAQARAAEPALPPVSRAPVAAVPAAQEPVDLAHVDLAHVDLAHVDLAHVDLAHVDLATDVPVAAAEPSPPAPAPVPVPLVLDLSPEPEPVAPPVLARVVPAPRRSDRTLPAFSPEAVEAAGRVLSAARTDQAAAARSAAAERARRSRAASPAARPSAVALVPTPRAPVAAAATSIALPVRSDAQLVLATAG